jgi:spore coat protein H
MKKKYFIQVIYLFIVVLVVNSCEKEMATSNDSDDLSSSSDSLGYNSDWTFASHGNASLDYLIVFPQDSANRIEISMTISQWNSIRTNMKSLFGGDFGSGMVGGGGPAGGGGVPSFADTETDYVDILLKFKGKSWKNVGFRLKGNSSLERAWKQGIYKLPFRLNFDKFEDTYPGIKNQHFFGFKELSFSPSFGDQSLMREKITPDIFRLAGISSAKTAFYRVYINFGSGLKYCGVYTAVELPDDSMIKDQLGEENGNIYKPESNLVSFVQSEFERKNNKTSSDYSDIQSFITVLNNSIRTRDAAQWRANLEAVFNVHYFIKYLAVNNAIVNWDSYGNMAHNYYLYSHSTDKLKWIPWDHNEALSGTAGITGSAIGQGENGMDHTPLSLSMNEVSASWPLIRYIADDPVYMTEYKSDLKWFNDTVFIENAITALIDKYSGLLSPYAIGVDGEKANYTYLTNSSSFTSAISQLKTHIVKRRTLITTYVH